MTTCFCKYIYIFTFFLVILFFFLSLCTALLLPHYITGSACFLKSLTESILFLISEKCTKIGKNFALQDSPPAAGRGSDIFQSAVMQSLRSVFIAQVRNFPCNKNIPGIALLSHYRGKGSSADVFPVL